MQTAKDIMTASVVSVNENQTLKDAIEILAKNHFSGIPVVDEGEKVIGIISNTDIVRYSQQLSVVPLSNLSGWVSPYTEVTDLASMRKGVDMLHRTSIGQVMTRKVHTMTENTPSADIAKLMSRRKINRVPVVDGTGKLVGIVTRADVVKCMANL